MIIRIISIILFITLSLTGCSSMSWLPWSSPVSLRSIQIISQPELKTERAIAFDVVFLKSKLLSKQFENLTPNDWFNKRESYMTGYPTQLSVIRWEFVPGYPVTLDSFAKFASEAYTVILFANYPDPDYSLISLTELENSRIIVNEKGLSVIELGDDVIEVKL